MMIRIKGQATQQNVHIAHEQKFQEVSLIKFTFVKLKLKVNLKTYFYTGNEGNFIIIYLQTFCANTYREQCFH